MLGGYHLSSVARASALCLVAFVLVTLLALPFGVSARKGAQGWATEATRSVAVPAKGESPNLAQAVGRLTPSLIQEAWGIAVCKPDHYPQDPSGASSSSTRLTTGGTRGNPAAAATSSSPAVSSVGDALLTVLPAIPQRGSRGFPVSKVDPVLTTERYALAMRWAMYGYRRYSGGDFEYKLRGMSEFVKRNAPGVSLEKAKMAVLVTYLNRYWSAELQTVIEDLTENPQDPRGLEWVYW